MAYTATKARYHVALNGQGLILTGAPDRLAYKCQQAPVYNARFGEGDRSYTDFSFWWFFAQTDWSAGIKDEIMWEDDAKFFYSTNIDVWSEPGSVKLSRKQTSDEDFAESIFCGVTAEVGGSTYNFIGTDDDADSRPRVYSAPGGVAQTWTDRSTTTLPTSQNIVSKMYGRLSRLWVCTVGVGTTYVVSTWDGTNWVDQTGDINTDAGLSFGPQASRCGCDYLGFNWIFVENFSNSQHALVKTAAVNPVASGAYALVFEKLTNAGRPIACTGYNGKIIYLLDYSNQIELREFDIASTTDSLIRTFKGTSLPQSWGQEGLLREKDGKLLITVPANEIWQLDGDSLSRIFTKDTFKRDILTNVGETSAYLGRGCVISDNKAWWGNLMYDGESFFNTFQDSGDVAANTVYPVFVDASDRIWHTGSADDSVLFYLDNTSAVYKGTADQNYLVFSNFDLVSGLDKLAYSLTLNFKKFVSGQSIVVEYTTDELTASTSWTVLGTASHTLDGAVATSKTFLFATPTTFRKIWFRVKLAAGGTDTPSMTDFIMQYYPVPAYKKQWSLNINLGDEVKLLDGQLVPTTGRELKSILERAWWTKSVLDFQDFDYAATQLNGALSSIAVGGSLTGLTITVDSTYDFPEQGNLRIEDEEITYTGKTPTTFTGCTRGARDTRAVAHSDDTVVNNGYKVILTEFECKVPIHLQDKDLEYQVGIALREA